MALKPKYVKGDEIPQEQRSHYVERDGVFVLDIEGGYADPARLSEFSTTTPRSSARSRI